MKVFIYIFICVASTIMLACTSSKKSFEQGNYYQSVMQSIDRLRKNPDHKKSQAILSESYPMAVKYYTSQAERYRTSNDRFKNGEMVGAFSMLNQLYDAIQHCPGALGIIPDPDNYYAEVTRHSGLAAAERYTAGEEAFAVGTRSSAREAYFHFIEAREYAPGYLDVENKILESKYMATLKVRVDQVPVPTWQYQLSVQFFQDQVEQFLFNYRDNEFVRFYATQDESLQDPDQILIFQFDDFVVGQTNNFQKTQQLQKDSVVVGQVSIKEGEKQDVYGTVKAKYTENRQEIISKGLLSMKIIDAYSNSVVLHEKLPGEFVWTSVWANYNGDERALSKEQLKITNMRPVGAPMPQDLFVEFCKPIYAQLQTKVRNYYRNI